MPSSLAKTLIPLLQLAGLVVIDQVAIVFAPYLPFPLPSSLVGMLLLFILLLAGVIHGSWLARAASLLQTHLAFFFVPIVVGLMGYSRLLQQHGVALLMVILVGTAAGIAVAGLIASPPQTRDNGRAVVP